MSESEIIGEVYDIIKNIKDPEKPQTLEELEVVQESDITVNESFHCPVIHIELTPTVPQCSLAAIIGLCVRTKLQRSWNRNYKLDISLKVGSHTSVEEVTKQLNDKERIAAAMENPNLREIIERCIKEDE